MNEIYYSGNYEKLKSDIKEELGRAANSFVRIGYLLKVARDTNVLAESGYANMEEFAYAEFKIDKGTASKFMAINDRFSEGGNSDHLLPEYNGIGWSKLSIMLQLPDSINEEISEDFSKAEIQTLREEFAEAQKITPMETILEGESPVTAASDDLLYKAIVRLGEDKPELFVKIHKAINEDYRYDLKEIKSIMAPAGENIYTIRIRGVGRYALSVKDHLETVALVNERSGEKETRLWDDVARAWATIIDMSLEPEKDWESIYDRDFPKETEVAPVQQKEEKKVVKVDDKPKKPVEQQPQEQTLHDIEESIPLPAPVEEEPEVLQAEVVESEEEIPGQDTVEEHAEWMPENNTIRGYRAAVTNELNRLKSLWDGDNKEKVSLMLGVMEDLKWHLEEIKKAEVEE